MNSAYYLLRQKQLAASKFYRYFWTFWGIYSVLLLFALGVYLLYLRQFKIIIVGLVAFALARGVIKPLISVFYKKPRPYQLLKFSPIKSWLFSLPHNRPNAFPSEHALSFAAIGVVFYFALPMFGFALLVTVLLNGVARIILGYHQISDVLAGWVLGLLAALLTLYAMRGF